MIHAKHMLGSLSAIAGTNSWCFPATLSQSEIEATLARINAHKVRALFMQVADNDKRIAELNYQCMRRLPSLKPPLAPPMEGICTSCLGKSVPS